MESWTFKDNYNLLPHRAPFIIVSNGFTGSPAACPSIKLHSHNEEGSVCS
jgi:hypothetical protein